MESEKYTKEIGDVVFTISSPPRSNEAEKTLADKLKKLILNSLKENGKSSIIPGQMS